MKIWLTELMAIDPKSGELKKWCGDDIEAPTHELAQKWCEENDKGYLKVIGKLVAEIPCKKNSFEPDFKNTIDYETIKNN